MAKPILGVVPMKKRGRPPIKNKKIVCSFRLPSTDYVAIKKIARDRHISVSELFRKLITELEAGERLIIKQLGDT